MERYRYKYSQLENRICQRCQKEFQIPKWRETIYCSASCAAFARAKKTRDKSIKDLTEFINFGKYEIYYFVDYTNNPCIAFYGNKSLDGMRHNKFKTKEECREFIDNIEKFKMLSPLLPFIQIYYFFFFTLN